MVEECTSLLFLILTTEVKDNVHSTHEKASLKQEICALSASDKQEQDGEFPHVWIPPQKESRNQTIIH